MKIKKHHYKAIRRSIFNLINYMGTDVIIVHIDNLKGDNRVKDIDKRLRWDLCHAAGLTGFMCRYLYNYLNDTHIDTALRQVMKDINM